VFYLVKKQIDSRNPSEGVKRNLDLLLKLVAVHDLLKNSVALFESEYITPSQFKLLKEFYKSLLTRVKD